MPNEIAVNEIEVNGVKYVKKGSSETPVKDGLEYSIVRTYSAGVFAGFVERNGTEATVHNARRLWYWEGAASLSQLAVCGVSNPSKCKFPCVVKRVELTGVIEVTPCTNIAKASIEGVPVWAK